MCGLFGWSLEPKVSLHSRRRAYRVLSHSNDKRGGHSFGAYLMDKQKIVRGLGKMARAKWTPGRAPIDNSRVICHTRFATHGNVTTDNAHPFRMGHVVGAHNGIIYNHEELNAAHERKFDVDSQHIFAHIAEGKDLSDLHGYGAITYVDGNEPERIYMGRFCLGELAVARLLNGKGIVWSSDDVHLERACRAAGWAYELMQIDNGTLYYVEGTNIYFTESKLDVRYKVWAPKKVDDDYVFDWRKHMLGEDEDSEGTGDFYHGDEKVI